LIEEQELDISQVSLAAVTEQFVVELERAEGLHPDELSDFLVVAAKLLYIKSKLLLPKLPDDEEDPGLDLERQLRMYKAYLDASRTIQSLLTRRRVLVFRDVPLPAERLFLPPVGLTSPVFHDLFESIIAGIAPIVLINERVMVKTVNIREKIEEIRGLLADQPSMKFQTLLERVANRTELIVTFLAMLELVKQRSVAVTQDDLFTDIHIQSLTESPGAPV
jgi:segregation and condensation protein A